MARNTQLISDFLTIRVCGSSFHDESNYEYEGACEGVLYHVGTKEDVMSGADLNPELLGDVSGLTEQEWNAELLANEETEGLNTWAQALLKRGFGEHPPMEILRVMSVVQMVMYLSDKELEGQIKGELDMEVELTIGSNDDDAKAIRRIGMAYGYDLADYDVHEDGSVDAFKDHKKWLKEEEAKTRRRVEEYEKRKLKD